MRARGAPAAFGLGALGALGACSLWLDFSPAGQPCSAQGTCLAGYQCVAGKCQTAPGGPQDGGADSGVPDAGCTGLQCQIPTCPAGQTTSLSGTVRDPAGVLPVYGATVYVPNATVGALPQGATCPPCAQWLSGQPIVSTTTGVTGAFSLTGVPAGTAIPLVIQRGRWRRQIQVSVQACVNNPVSDASGLANLPRNQAEGDIPKMALVTGLGDEVECTLLRMGVDAAEFTPPDAGGRIHLYLGNGNTLDGGLPPSDDLFAPGEAALAPYDAILLPCQSVATVPVTADLQALSSYLSNGGRLLTTHYGYGWIAPTYATAADWREDGGFTTPLLVSIDTGFPAGRAFADWADALGVTDGGVLVVTSPRDDVGVVKSPTTAWIYGDDTGLTVGTNYDWTPYLSFDTGAGTNASCGRVGFFDFHVLAGSGIAGEFPSVCPATPLTADEEAAVFLLFDLNDCPSP